MTSRFKQPIWILPLIIAGLVALFGWWGNHELRQTIEQQLRDQLTSTLNANVTALEIWTTNQTRLATELAGEPEVRTRAVRILTGQSRDPVSTKVFPTTWIANSYSAISTAPQSVGLRNRATGEHQFHHRHGLDASRPGPHCRSPRRTPTSSPELFSSGSPVIITPFKPELLIQRRAGLQNRGTNIVRASGFFANRENMSPAPNIVRRGPIA